MKINPQLKEELKARLFSQAAKEKEKVFIFSTYQLSPDEMTRLMSTLPDLKDRPCINVVEKSLLGGVIVQYGSKIIDLSIRHLLQTFQKTIHETH
ncbi:F0F1 ATP synthase subunit delta [Candidatus Roizmanbacteria bacterium]|nr:F0F1 ATP synthase subunit delta [Candidatus Roizmanbacteria bacterium]